MALDGDAIACPTCNTVVNMDKTAASQPSPTSSSSSQQNLRRKKQTDGLYGITLQLQNADGTAFNGFLYKIFTKNGGTYVGKADDNGNTKVLESQQPQEITKVKILMDNVQTCCSAITSNTSSSYTFKLDKPVPLNQPLSQKDHKIVTLKTKGRLLTAGELALAKNIFKDSIDYSKVKIHRGEYLWFGIQNNHTAMTPNGEMYFPKNIYKKDYSDGDNFDKHLFVHEMVHIWQYRLGYSVKSVGIWIGMKGGYGKGAPAYQYEHLLSTRKKLSEFNMEQQADIIADFFVGNIYQRNLNHTNQMIILADFIDNPNNNRLLPDTTRF
ncbi:MAG TPA: hypothetical protein DD638_07410 [Pasteurellaceae bacterium]|nr:hypothetical protein [Pasteurellaceae bacterium]